MRVEWGINNSLLIKLELLKLNDKKAKKTSKYDNILIITYFKDILLNFFK